MTTSNARKKLAEALDRAYELTEELTKATQEAQQFRVAYNELKTSQDISALEQEKDTVLEAVAQKAQDAYDKAVSTAQSALDKAQKSYEDACVKAHDVRDSTVSDASESWAAKIAEAQRELDIQAAGAQAEAHTADQRVANLNADLNKHYERVNEQLGVQLKGIIEAPKE